MYASMLVVSLKYRNGNNKRELADAENSDLGRFFGRNVLRTQYSEPSEKETIAGINCTKNTIRSITTVHYRQYSTVLVPSRSATWYWNSLSTDAIQ